jgi:hypothetical protein
MVRIVLFGRAGTRVHELCSDDAQECLGRERPVDGADAKHE